MKINGIIWPAQFVEKIEKKHGVSTEEVAEVFDNRPRVRLVEKGDVSGEPLYRAAGQADAGRYLAVFFIRKRRGDGLVISARDASPRERRGDGKK